MMKIILPDLPTGRGWRELAVKRYYSAKNNKTCLSYWFPKIQVGLPEIRMPETYLVRVDDMDFLKTTDGIPPTPQMLLAVERMKEAARKVGYPCFLKNSLFSGKHEWNDMCYVENAEQMQEHAIAITYMAACVGCESSLYFVVRKLIKTNPLFVAFQGMPITTERIFFVKDGGVYHVQDYWPPDSIQSPSVENWKEILEADKMTKDEFRQLWLWSEQISLLLGGGWSIDWLKDADGNWWLTDMAEDYKSYIWGHDKNQPK